MAHKRWLGSRSSLIPEWSLPLLQFPQWSGTCSCLYKGQALCVFIINLISWKMAFTRRPKLWLIPRWLQGKPRRPPRQIISWKMAFTLPLRDSPVQTRVILSIKANPNITSPMINGATLSGTGNLGDTDLADRFGGLHGRRQSCRSRCSQGSWQLGHGWPQYEEEKYDFVMGVMTAAMSFFLMLESWKRVGISFKEKNKDILTLGNVSNG